MGQKKAVNGPSGSSGLEPMGNGTVYDSNLGVFWLADANLAGDPRVRKMLGAPEGYKVISLLAIGPTAEETHADKRPLSDVLHWEKF